MSDECTCELMYEDAMASMPEEFAAVARTATDIEGEGDLLIRCVPCWYALRVRIVLKFWCNVLFILNTGSQPRHAEE